MDLSILRYADADESIKDRIEKEWGPKAARYMHLIDGFSIVAVRDALLVGLISVYRKKLPAPLSETFDWYVDILEVHQDFRRLRIATRLIDIVCERAKKEGVYQIRSWSSEDRTEAIPMWKALGFALCPTATYPQGKEVKGYFVAKVL